MGVDIGTSNKYGPDTGQVFPQAAADTDVIIQLSSPYRDDGNISSTNPARIQCSATYTVWANESVIHWR